MNSKQKREIVFNKYGGYCSYCGCDLKEIKWHMDHAEPIERKQKRVDGCYYWKGTENQVTAEEVSNGSMDLKEMEWRPSRLVAAGCRNPQHDHIDNLIPACASCNINKHSMNIEEFRRFIGRFIVSLNRDSVQYKISKRYGLIQETGIEVKFYFESTEQSKQK